MRAGGDLFADVLEFSVEIFSPPMYQSITHEQLDQDRQGDEQNSPGHAKFDAGGDVQDTDRKAEQRQNRLQRKRQYAI